MYKRNNKMALQSIISNVQYGFTQSICAGILFAKMHAIATLEIVSFLFF